MGEERRHFLRVAGRLTTILTLPKTGKVQRALTKNISAGGLALITEAVLPPGTPLELEIRLPDRATPLTLTAEVVWSRSTGVATKRYEPPPAETGVRFVHIHPQDQTLLIQYARLNAPVSPDG